MKNSIIDKIHHLVSQVPKGKITTYGALARKLRNKFYARAIGQALGRNENNYYSNKQKIKKIPCHRVVKQDGRIGGYNVGFAKKKRLLQAEGITIKKDMIQNFSSFLHLF